MDKNRFNEDLNEERVDELMPCSSNNGVAYRISQALSIIFHPFVIPIYTSIILLFGTPVMFGVALNVKFYFIALITLTTFVTPILILAFLKYVGIVNDLSFFTRKDRVIPIVVLGSCYVLCSIIVPVSIISFLIKKFLFIAICCISIAFLVNFYWKISLHLIAMGGLTALIIYSSVTNYHTYSYILILAILFSGALASARLYLGSHKLSQVVLGYSVGVIVSLLVIYAV